VNSISKCNIQSDLIRFVQRILRFPENEVSWQYSPDLSLESNKNNGYIRTAKMLLLPAREKVRCPVSDREGTRRRASSLSQLLAKDRGADSTEGKIPSWLQGDGRRPQYGSPSLAGRHKVDFI
jgi:hypothetical protein